MKRLTGEWVQKAEADMAAATALGKLLPAVRDAVCFHFQQAAESYLKALLQETGLPAPRTHDLDPLLQLLLPGHRSLRPLRRELKTLTRYAVEYRYPGVSANSRQVQT